MQLILEVIQILLFKYGFIFREIEKQAITIKKKTEYVTYTATQKRRFNNKKYNLRDSTYNNCYRNSYMAN